jgi:hypothetical protein
MVVHQWKLFTEMFVVSKDISFREFFFIWDLFHLLIKRFSYLNRVTQNVRAETLLVLFCQRELVDFLHFYSLEGGFQIVEAFLLIDFSGSEVLLIVGLVLGVVGLGTVTDLHLI